VNNIDLTKAVFTVKGIVYDSKSILYVIHDMDDEWQFLSGDNVSMEDMIIVPWKEIIRIDPSISSLNLEMGYEAFRVTQSSNWAIRKVE